MAPLRRQDKPLGSMPRLFSADVNVLIGKVVHALPAHWATTNILLFVGGTTVAKYDDLKSQNLSKIDNRKYSAEFVRRCRRHVKAPRDSAEVKKTFQIQDVNPYNVNLKVLLGLRWEYWHLLSLSLNCTVFIQRRELDCFVKTFRWILAKAR